MRKITYEDKVAVNVNPDIPDINKVNADDMNEIKSVVNENANINEYSTTEQVIGKWINGKPIYRKVVPLGTLPNQDTIQVSSGLDSNIVRIVHIYGVVTDKTNYEAFPIPFSWGSNTEIQNFCGIFFGGTGSSGNVWFRTNRNMSNYEGYAILEYTKTTD